MKLAVTGLKPTARTQGGSCSACRKRSLTAAGQKIDKILTVFLTAVLTPACYHTQIKEGYHNGICA